MGDMTITQEQYELTYHYVHPCGRASGTIKTRIDGEQVLREELARIARVGGVVENLVGRTVTTTYTDWEQAL